MWPALRGAVGERCWEGISNLTVQQGQAGGEPLWREALEYPRAERRAPRLTGVHYFDLIRAADIAAKAGGSGNAAPRAAGGPAALAWRQHKLKKN